VTFIYEKENGIKLEMGISLAEGFDNSLPKKVSLGLN
jgi:hypothetical protein